MASIMCRKGETFPNFHTHSSVAEVRACQQSGKVSAGPAETRSQPRRDDREWSAGGSKPVSQQRYYGKVAQTLAADRARTEVEDADARFDAMMQRREQAQDDAAYAADIDAERWTVPTSGNKIDNAQPKRVSTFKLDEIEEKVPAGRYAIGVEGETKFYKIDKPTEGRWEGYTFVKVQASDELYPVKNRTVRYEVLSAIVAQGIQKSMERYGRELGRCGAPNCGRTLTDPESIARGIGPVCAGKMGW